jgi:phage-related minor tail protein
MLVGELMAKLGVDRSEFDAGLDEAERVGKSRGELIGGALKGAVMAGVAGLAVVVGAALTTAFNAASDNNQAINNLQASLGVTREEAERLSKEGQQLWTNGFGGNLIEANERITSVRQNIKGLADEELAEVAAGNTAIAESFNEEASRVDSAVNSLMTNMGLSYQQAQDFITAGFQRGLNASGDFLDSITEYGPQFAELGASGQEMFSALETGFQNGVLGTDKVADLFKETRLRISEDTPATRTALQSLGIDADEFYEGLRDGSLTGVEAFQRIQEGLRATQDPVAQNTAAIALMGTQWEDLGASTVLSIDLQATSLASLAGATDGLSVKYNNLGAVGEGLWRRTQVALIPVGDKMLELANAVMPHVHRAFDWLEVNVPKAIGAVETGFSIAIEAARPVISQVQNVVAAFQRGGDSSNQLSGVLTFLGDTWTKTGTVIKLTAELVQAIVVPIFRGIAQFLRDHSTEIETVLRSAWTMIQAVIDTVLAVITGLLRAALAVMRGDWQGAWDAIYQMLVTVWNNIRSYLTAAVDGIKALLSLAWSAISGTAQSAWNSFYASAIEPGLNTVKSGVDGMIGGIKTTVDGAWGDIKEGSRRAWEGIASTVSSAFSGAVRGIKGVINDIIGDINEAIDNFNDLPGPDIPKIPKLAKGTNFFEGGLAIVGEQGPELVSMPRGSQVFPAGQTREMLGGGTVINNYYPNAVFENAQVSQESLNSSVALLQMLGSGT